MILQQTSTMLWQNLPSVTRQMHGKTDVNLFFTIITRPEAGQMPGLNKVFKRQV